MILYGTSTSPFVRKTMFFIAEKEIVVDHVPLMFHDPSPAFQEASPFGKIPALEDGDFRLSDSSAICHYLERKFPDRPLLPVEPQAYGRTIWFDKFVDTMLVPALGKVFFQLYVKPRLYKQEPDMAVVEKGLAEEIPKVYAFLEQTIAGPFLVGDTLTLADIAVASPFFNIALAGHPVDAAQWPTLAAYVAAIQARPAFMAIGDKRRSVHPSAAASSP